LFIQNKQTEIICKVCGNLGFVTTKHYKKSIKKNENHSFTCCRKCQDELSITKENVECLNCKKIFLKRRGQISKSPNHFCTKSCSASYWNTLQPKRKTSISTTCKKIRDLSKTSSAPKYCKYCFERITRSYTYCSSECKQAVQKEKALRRFNNGECKTASSIKTAFKYLNIVECQICGQKPMWNNKPLTLQLDHINGNSDNNYSENLRLICPNCHTQTETFAARNMRQKSERSETMKKFYQKYKNK